jgi:hypothetical protein
MAGGLVLKSASYEPGGEKAREHNTVRAIEGAGYEVEKKLELPDDRDTSGLNDDQRLQKHAVDYGKQVEAAKLKYGTEEWNRTLNQEVQIGQAAQLAILEQKNGAEICWYLGQHPDYAQKLGKMPPLVAAGEVAKLADRLPQPVRVSRPVKVPADATFAEIASMKDWPGKVAALKRAARRR